MSVERMRSPGAAADVRLVTVGVGLGTAAAPDQQHSNTDQRDQRDQFQNVFHHRRSVVPRLGAPRCGRPKSNQMAHVHFAPAARSLSGRNSASFKKKHHQCQSAERAKADNGQSCVAHLTLPQTNNTCSVARRDLNIDAFSDFLQTAPLSFMKNSANYLDFTSFRRVTEPPQHCRIKRRRRPFQRPGPQVPVHSSTNLRNISPVMRVSQMNAYQKGGALWHIPRRSTAARVYLSFWARFASSFWASLMPFLLAMTVWLSQLKAKILRLKKRPKLSLTAKQTHICTRNNTASAPEPGAGCVSFVFAQQGILPCCF